MISQQINDLFMDYFFESEMDTEDDPSVLNCGWCYIWAHIAYKLYGGKLCSIYLDGKLHHAVLKLNGKYYDPEHLSGEVNFQDLKCIRRHSRDIKKGVKVSLTEDSVKEFFNKWNYKPDNDLFLYGVSKFALINRHSYV